MIMILNVDNHSLKDRLSPEIYGRVVFMANTLATGPNKDRLRQEILDIVEWAINDAVTRGAAVQTPAQP